MHLLATGEKGAPDLVVEIDAVRDQDHAWIYDGGMQGERLCQHDHGDRFAAAGGMPDDATCTSALRIERLNPCDGGFDGEVLLVASDLLDAGVVDDELVDQLQQPFWTQQAIHCAVLRGR